MVREFKKEDAIEVAALIARTLEKRISKIILWSILKMT